MQIYFADTYALVEYVGGNKVFKKYFTEQTIITTKLNLLELHYSLLRNGDYERADAYYDSFLSCTVDLDDGVLKKASVFKLENRHKDISYVDAIGYQTAVAHNALFLTGDKEFKNFKCVEFVK